MTYEEFLVFVFDHPPVEEGQDPWYYKPDDDPYPLPPDIYVDYLTRLCSDFKSAVAPYSIDQIDEGIWFLIGPALSDNIFEDSVGPGKRLECIRSMYHVYADFVAGSDIEVMPTCFQMWWDMLADEFWGEVWMRRTNILEVSSSPDDASDWPGYSADDLLPDERTMLDAMFETLMRILELDDWRCREYALHGLGHLRHPNVHDTVQAFIDRYRKELEESDMLAWVESCRDSTVR